MKIQALVLAAKLHILAPDQRELSLLCRYVFSLARYDSSYDVRDRARMLGGLLTGVAPQLFLSDSSTDYSSQEEIRDQSGVILRREQVKLILFEGKLRITEKAVEESVSRSLFPRIL